jgi:hypothetical protein
VNRVGNVLDTQLLKQAGVENVQAVILALNTDSTTLFATVIFKDLAPDVPVIARVNRAENVERIYAAGADFALSISQVSGQLLAWRLLGKESVAVDPELRVIKVSTRGLEKYHPGHSDIRVKTGCTVVAIERGEQLLVEFLSRFSLRAGRCSLYLRQRRGGAEILSRCFLRNSQVAGCAHDRTGVDKNAEEAMAPEKKARPFSMLRSYQLADLITLANGAAGTSSVFAAMSYLTAPSIGAFISRSRFCRWR